MTKIQELQQTKVLEQVYHSLLFRNMERSRAEAIIARVNGKIRTYEKGEIVLVEESALSEIGILLSGELCKVQVYGNGTEQMVQKLEPGYVTGLEIAVSIKKTSPYCMYASEKSEVYWFSVHYLEQEGMLAECDRIHLYQEVVRFLANEDIRKYRKIEILSAKGARERIELYLKIQENKFNSREFTINFNREELANYLGLNRSVLSHELKKMEKDGILSVRKNHFVLL